MDLIVMRALRSQRGFTVGELIAVVGLIALLSAAMVPTASVIISHHRLQAAARQLGFEVARVRMQAVGQNLFVRITLVDPSHYVIERSTDGGNTYAAVGPAVALPTGQTVVAGQTGTPSFNRQGLAPASTTLTVKGPAGQKTLSISVIGRVRVT